ncbi:bsr7049 [Bradyrhizobium diazoefficiens USDA 110]|uniref:Bsr7049 protein n=2 Tax=Bradyrhizobium diazoefficiens TaxID=1355477 RepID=Q89EM4_BRADU|nr:hypothetical protein CO678_37785 [Bradyrhizobium diazoefficiens]QBP25794.1 hypothetical protein Bdiaspc4_37195 [Bradyrhizobium diazoefficiens]QHP73230.1 hypothetical protein EI171_42020 [Bradyrhizobium sp. LCT2]BAC52314.1 bsr7049 [Bradyrhizobium diazoefficiens USDA 110]
MQQGVRQSRHVKIGNSPCERRGEAMLRDEQLSILRDISQSIAFADDRQGKMGQLIADGYVMKDGDLFELTAKGVTAVEEHAAALGESDATSTPSYRLI